MARITPRRTVAAIIIATGILALLIPFLIHYPSSTNTITPPSPSGGNGGTPPPSTRGGGNGSGSGSGGSGGTPLSDTTPPVTTLSVNVNVLHNGCRDYEESFAENATTITLHAADDSRLASIALNDTGRVRIWNVTGASANVTLALTVPGVHVLTYWSTDAAGNKETPHTTTVTVTVLDNEDHEHGHDDSGLDNSHKEETGLAKGEHHGEGHEKNCRESDRWASDSSPLLPNTVFKQEGLDQALANLLQTILQLMQLIPSQVGF